MHPDLLRIHNVRTDQATRYAQHRHHLHHRRRPRPPGATRRLARHLTLHLAARLIDEPVLVRPRLRARRT